MKEDLEGNCFPNLWPEILDRVIPYNPYKNTYEYSFFMHHHRI